MKSTLHYQFSKNKTRHIQERMYRYKIGMQITTSFIHCTGDCATNFPKDDVPKCLVCPQLKDIPLTVRGGKKPENVHISDDYGIREL